MVLRKGIFFYSSGFWRELNLQNTNGGLNHVLGDLQVDGNIGATDVNATRVTATTLTGRLSNIDRAAERTVTIDVDNRGQSRFPRVNPWSLPLQLHSELP